MLFRSVIRALESARNLGWKTIAFVGFDGGKILENSLAQHILYVKSSNYGVVEDVHQMIMHSVSQTIRYEHAKDLSKLKL